MWNIPCPCGYPTSGWLEPYDTAYVHTHCVIYDLSRTCPADIDRDHDVDEADYALFAGCYNGAGNQYPPQCKRADFDLDNDVDGDDYAYFASCFNGVGNPPACMP
jgi:hypothetical protein